MVSNRDLQLNSGMKCAKYMLLVVSFMFALTAVLLVMVGSTIQAIFGDFRQFIDDHFLSPPTLLVAIGFILLAVAALGAYGAVKESVMLINVYGLLLFLVFILEVAAAIAAFVMQGEVREMLQRTMNDAMESDNQYMRDGFNFLQSTFECCGVNGPEDWESLYEQTSNDTIAEGTRVPESCCGEIVMQRDGEATCAEPFESGCYPRLRFIISQSIMLICTGATTVAFVQFLGVLCAFMLAKTLRRNKSLREARRWQLQQSLGVLISGGKMSPPVNSPMTAYTQLEKADHYADNKPYFYTPNSPSVN